MGPYYVYILESERRGRLYIGLTDDLGDRLARHRGNRVLSTRRRGPWALLGYWTVSSRSAAVRLERWLKSLKNLALVRELLKRYPNLGNPTPIPGKNSYNPAFPKNHS